MKRSALFLIKIYQFFTPFFKMMFGVQGNCRFSPSCSQFTQQAIVENGIHRGLRAGLKRIASCHPFHFTRIMH